MLEVFHLFLDSLSYPLLLLHILLSLSIPKCKVFSPKMIIAFKIFALFAHFAFHMSLLAIKL